MLGVLDPKILKVFDFYEEVRFDINPLVKSDTIGALTDMHAVECQTMGAIYSSHNIEYRYPDEVPIAIGEFFRVAAFLECGALRWFA